MRRSPTPLAALLICGCAYFNGVYNAKSAARSADKQSRRGEQFTAADDYRRSAATAETVLVRHPKSRWRADALYLAGRGFALAGDCGPGLRRLGEYLELPNQPVERRERAEIARASCLFSANQLMPAREVLAPLLESRDDDVRSEAALWAGRAALQMGNVDRAQELLATVPGAVAVWEFMAAATTRGDLATAESLLVSRARAGDWRSDVPRYVRLLWDAGRSSAAIAVTDLYGRSRAPVSDRVTLHFLASDLAVGAGDTALARRQIIAAQGVGVAASVDAQARARLLALRIRELDRLADVEAAIARDSARTRGAALVPRLRDHVARMKLFLEGPNAGGVGVFHAAEIARDSLHAYRLALSMFRTIETDFADFSLAARALLAARTMFPESTAVYEARVLEKWPRSGAAFALTTDSTLLATLRNEDRQLVRAWEYVTRQWDDTLRARRVADSIAAAQGIRRQ